MVGEKILTWPIWKCLFQTFDKERDIVYYVVNQIDFIYRLRTFENKLTI